MEFTEKEKKYLISAIENRIGILNEEIQDEKVLISDKHYKKSKSLIRMLNMNEPISNSYISFLAGIVKDNYYADVEIRKEIYYDKSDLEILNINDDELNEIEYINEIDVLLNKLLTKDNKESLLKDYLKPYDELKMLTFEKSFYSKSGNKIYKIGIPIDNKNLINIELDHDHKIYPFQKNNILNIKNSFMFEGSNDDILNLFFEYEKEKKLTERMKFVKELFKSNY